MAAALATHQQHLSLVVESKLRPASLHAEVGGRSLSLQATRAPDGGAENTVEVPRSQLFVVPQSVRQLRSQKDAPLAEVLVAEPFEELWESSLSEAASKHTGRRPQQRGDVRVGPGGGLPSLDPLGRAVSPRAYLTQIKPDPQLPELPELRL